jgi:nitrite reductase/ring-hydroxylating ferredoxin subunit
MRFPFTSFPKGVFAVLFSRELKTGQVLAISFMNMKLTLFRTTTGTVGAIDGYCPHLGADLSFGSVKKNTLQCPFHGLRFKVNGTCVAKNRASQTGTFQIKHWQVFEKYGLIFLTYNFNSKNFQIRLPEWDEKEWGRPIQHCFKIKSHPQEIIENSVDQLHFFQVHKYCKMKVVEPIKIHGSEFTIHYEIERKKGILGEKKKIQFQLKIHAYGLGISHVDIFIQNYKLHAKQIIFPTPIDGEFIYVRTLTTVKIMENIACIPYFLKKIIANLLTKLANRGFLKDFLPDLKIWENKKYIEYPRYLAKDGEFEKYRSWAKQFYHGLENDPK